jgi:LPXTG-motif cell wall-anchored protein
MPKPVGPHQDPAHPVPPSQRWLLPAMTIVSALVAALQLVLAAVSLKAGNISIWSLVSGLVFLALTGLCFRKWRQQRIDSRHRDKE